MAAGFRFEPDTAGIFHVANGEAVGPILTQRARDAAREVRRLAPRKRGFFDYRRGVRARAARRVGSTIEAAVEVVTPGWHLPEYGTTTHPPTAPLRRGVKAAGIDFQEGAR